MLSAFTLSDLPDAQTRMEKLLTLWNKCDGYLVLVENGTANGFPLINEARDFLMQQITFGEEEAHIFAPVNEKIINFWRMIIIVLDENII